MAAPQSAASRVFAITELIEKTLEELPIIDLLISQHVCKKYRKTVKGPLRLQQALYLEPLPEFVDLCGIALPPYTILVTTVLVSASPQDSTINPLLANAWQYSLKEDAKHSARSNPHASWRDMLVSQPPIFEMRLGAINLHTIKSKCFLVRTLDSMARQLAKSGTIRHKGRIIRGHSGGQQVQTGQSMGVVLEALEEGWNQDETSVCTSELR
ncbi:Hypothetical predicted protein [Lecanosticta acicola]|uniref:F-box domain-containing protein n=1 Tax=Lecanosticta acicola TaxID=111012 RepID=A0AAI8YT60_9PEZI|nr:Hypothetical predicted protein [Lecanosticta acicola]